MKISKLSFVSHLDAVRSWKKIKKNPTVFEDKKQETKLLQNPLNGDKYNYGSSYASLKQINVVDVNFNF